MKNSRKILGLDLGTASVGWALTTQDFENKTGEITGLGSRIIPMGDYVTSKKGVKSKNPLVDFSNGVGISKTRARTDFRSTRKLYHRIILRRERLHRVLNILDFLPKHYGDAIDFKKHFGQFKKGQEIKLNYRENKEGKHEFLFMDSFNEMVAEFKAKEQETKIPLDWTLYYLRKKALTQKITKEELAWVILNFNQKRGYYQLRGEEIENDENKEIKFYVLTVKKIEATSDKNAKGVWYNVTFFENDWVCPRQSKEPLDSWVEKPKEFIITTTKNKDGSIKRSFRHPKEDDWGLVKKKTEQNIEESTKMVGEYIYDNLLQNPTQKIKGGLIKIIERKYYKEEFKTIIKKQIEFHSEIDVTKDIGKDLYKSCIEELYPRNEAHQQNIKDKGFDYLFLDDIIFYQRPLKSKKSTIANCPYEERTFYYKDGERKDEKGVEHLKCISKSNPLFQEFRLWQFLKNLEIYQRDNNKNNKKDVKVTSQFLNSEENWVALFDFLNERKEISQKNIIDYFVKLKKIEKSEEDNYRWNYVEDKKFPANETRYLFLSRLEKVENLNATKFLTKEKEQSLWHLVYSVKDKTEFETALRTFAIKNEIDENYFVENFKKTPPFKSDYGSYSEKAIKKILPLMRMGKYWNENEISEDVKSRISNIIERLESINYDEEVFKIDKENRLKTIADDIIPKQFLKSFLPFKDKNPLTGLNTYQACYAIYERHSEVGIIEKWDTPSCINLYLKRFRQHSLRNPIVEQVVTETLRVVRDIWEHYGYGEAGFFDEIHVELGRSMKNSSEKRKAMSSINTENENTNQRIKDILEELKDETNQDIRPYSPSHQEILKIYEEGVYQNPDVKFDGLKEEDIKKIRENKSPTKPKASPTSSDIKKYKLWLEQGYISPYTGQIIPLSDLFSINYEIEHIIPQSRYFDNYMSNKVICESVINPNPYKDNQTAYEFLKKQGGQIISELSTNNKTIKLFTLEEYEAHCNKYFKKNRTKLKNLLSEEIPEGFINRQLNDSRYISKFIKGLLSNIVREEGEREAIAKRLIPVTGAITSKLKQDWGLNDKWNELVQPRFERLNKLTNSNDFGYETEQKRTGKKFFRTQVPDAISKGFNKKRIDHRHHALDALVIACCSRKHTNYLNSLNAEKENYSLRDSLLIKENGNYTKHFKMPWNNFPKNVKEELELTVVSFKQNLRVINKTNNKTWQWVTEKNGKVKKELVKQKGQNWAIRKPMHKENPYGKVKIKKLKKGLSNVINYLEDWDLIVDKDIRNEVKRLSVNFDKDTKRIKKHLKENPLTTNQGEKLIKIQVYEWTKNATAKRVSLTYKFTRKQLESVTDGGIQTILNNHIKNYVDEKGVEKFDLAFNPEGIVELNKNIKVLNNGKNHHPIYKVRLYEEGDKFEVGETGNKRTKFVEAAQGTNLFFAIYYDEEKEKRVYETVPLNEVIAYQKQTAHLPKNKRFPIPVDPLKGRFLFSLSPNDLVYVPTDEEIDNPTLVDFKNLRKEQIGRVFVVNDFSTTCYFTPNYHSKSIAPKEVDMRFNNKGKITGSFDDKTASFGNEQIKDICWKLKMDRLGNIIEIVK